MFHGVGNCACVDEGESFFLVTYDSSGREVRVFPHVSHSLSIELLENVSIAPILKVYVCASSESSALEKALHLFQEAFELATKEISTVISAEIDKRKKWFLASFVLSAQKLRLTRIAYVPVEYGPDVIYPDKISNYDRFFLYVQAEDEEGAYEKALNQFKLYIEMLGRCAAAVEDEHVKGHSKN